MSTPRILVVGLVAGLCFLGGCKERTHQRPAPDASAIARAQAVTSRPAWLHAHMPAHTVAYVRVPSPWTLAGATPTGGPLDHAAVGKRQLKIVAQLRKAAAKQPQLAGGMIAPLIDLLLSHLDSPLEAALVDPTGMPTPNAHLLLVARLDIGDAGQLQQLINSLPTPALHMTGPFDAKGDGALAMGARVHFDAASKRVFVLAGMHPATPAQMSAVLVGLGKPAATPPSMARLEPGIDASGQGLFAWIKLKGLASLAASKLPPSMSGALPGNLLDQADAVALGAGTVDGHGRIRIAFSAPGARLLGYLAPTLDFDGLQASGTPHWAFTLALPDAARMKRFEGNLNLELGPEAAKSYRHAMDKLKAQGVPSLQTLAQLLGPELVVFGDAQGTYSALRVHDVDAFHRELDTLAAKYHWKTGKATSGKARVHWLTVPSLLAGRQQAASNAAKSPDERAFLQLMARQHAHLYWSEEGHWLVFADVPQALADRAAADRHTSMAKWLHAQHYPAATWIGATAVNHNAQRQAYYAYLQVLQTLGDLLDRPVDLMKLPSATKLGLPEQGSIGGGLVLTQDTAALDLDYQQLPTELMHGKGAFTTIAVAGILAAIAIPQYQAYIVKSQFSESQVIADGLKTPIIESLAQSGRCPANGSAGLSPPDSYSGKYVRSATTGGTAPACTIRVVFKAAGAVSAPLAGKTVTFTAARTEHGLDWRCEAPDIAVKYLPSACRNP